MFFLYFVAFIVICAASNKLENEKKETTIFRDLFDQWEPTGMVLNFRDTPISSAWRDVGRHVEGH